MNNTIQRCIVRLGFVVLLGCALILCSVDANAEASFSCDSQWHVMATANAATQSNDYNLLGAVAALSTTDVWAVGVFNQFTQPGYKTLAEHWDGAKWKLAHTPNTSQLNNLLAGVAATDTNDVWAVGAQGAVLHWDGSTWSARPSPTSATINSINLSRLLFEKLSIRDNSWKKPPGFL